LIDLCRESRWLLSPSHPALAQEPGGEAALEELRAGMRTLFGDYRVSLLGDEASACAAVADRARQRTGRARVLAWFPVPREVPGWERVESEDALLAELDRGDVAAVMTEPSARVLEASRKAGAQVVFDETETLYRLASGSLQVELGLAADTVMVGETLAAGRPFAAVLDAEAELEGACAEASVQAACATLRVVREDADFSRRMAAGSDALVRVFDETCRAENILARWVGAPGRRVIEFEGQEGAPPELIREHFVKELADRGLECGGVLYPSAWMEPEELERACDALAANVRRARALLIEYNSYLSGGVPYVFPTDSPVLAERGIALYRFPREGPVKVSPDGAAMLIDVRPGPLGEVTSSGFYIPTRIRGDFSVRVRYSILAWKPGDTAACLALFVQDEPSLARYYAQQMSSAEDGDRHWLLANFTGNVGERVPADAHAGEFRIDREGTRARCWQRPIDGEWRLLGEHRDESAPDMFIGAKIWSAGESGGLRARLSELSIEGEVAAEQPPPVPVRADPVS